MGQHTGRILKKNLCLPHTLGIIFNKKKFVFGKKEAEFQGFEITPDSVHPASTYLQAIQDFPQPTDITGIRSWFGLVNQVADLVKMGGYIHSHGTLR